MSDFMILILAVAIVLGAAALVYVIHLAIRHDRGVSAKIGWPGGSFGIDVPPPVQKPTVLPRRKRKRVKKSGPPA